MKFNIYVSADFDVPGIQHAGKILTQLHDLVLRERGKDTDAAITYKEQPYVGPERISQARTDPVSGPDHPGAAFEGHPTDGNGSPAGASPESPRGSREESSRQSQPLGSERPTGRSEDSGPRGASREPEGRVSAPGAEPVKRRRGRPPKARPATEGSEPGILPYTPIQGTSQGREPDDDERADEGSRDGQERRAEGHDHAAGRSDEAGRDPGSDPDEADIGDDETTWEDEPAKVYVKADVTNALTKLYQAMGSKAQRQHVLDYLGSICGFTQIGDIDPGDYGDIVRVLETEAQLYSSGRKKLKA